MSEIVGPAADDDETLEVAVGREEAHGVSDERLAQLLQPLLVEHEVKWRGHGVIYVDHQPDNIETSLRIIADLSRDLGLPAHVVRTRLIESRLLKDVRDTPFHCTTTQRIVDLLASSKWPSTTAPEHREDEDPEQN